MKIARTKAELQDAVQGWKNEGLSVGFVPTMGALHAGHLSLVDLAQEKADRLVVSIYVNPTQFGPNEDFDRYPRDEAQDLAFLRERKTDLVYLPHSDEVYRDGRDNPITLGEGAKGLETDFRPHFFAGVANVVSRLFEHVRPDFAVFGEKDYQQYIVVQEMVAAYGGPEIIGAPIARDEYGLALSSRNAYLSAEELAVARQLNVILRDIAQNLSSFRRKPESFRAEQQDPGLRRDDVLGDARDDAWGDALEGARSALLEAGFDKVDYVAERWGRVLAAAWIGKTRLIDNMAL